MAFQQRLSLFFLLLINTLSIVFSKVSNNEYRLPTTIVPIEYNITLQPNFTDFTFIGSNEILIAILISNFNSTLDINKYFHIQMNIGPDMKIIQNVSLLFHPDGYEALTYYATNTNYNNNTQIVTFTFNIFNFQIRDYIRDNNGYDITAKLYIAFKNKLRNDMKGFYISKYNYEDTIIYNAVTQFESTDARRAFPCFDEPSFKASFRISIIAPFVCNVLSNMPISSVFDIKSDEHYCYYNAPQSMGGINSKCKLIQFEITPPMSSYLVAFVIGLYNNVSTITSSNYNLPISIYFPHNSDSNHANYALNAASIILPYYEYLFNISFPLPKMDCIALSDFSAGAMENWGLVTYRRTALLVDESTSSESALRRVVVVIAHEFAHQWFGDIVTMNWWNDLWLNEGFASFIEFIGTNYSNPSFEYWNFFDISMTNVLNIDSSFYTHSIELTVNNPNEIDTLFDSITYDKGMSVIRMLYEYIGKNMFMNGISEYLKLYEYSNSNTQQLWHSLGDNITSLMNTFVLQPGVPIINITIQNIDTESDTITFNVEQNRMCKQGPTFWDVPNREDSGYKLKYDTNLVNKYHQQLWHIPLEIERIDGSLIGSDSVMTTRNNQYTIPRIQIDDDNNNEYYIFNRNMNGYFRVLYDSQLIQFILNSWLNGYISIYSKYSILSDYYSLMLSDYITASSYLQFISTISKYESKQQQPSFLIWNIILNSLIKIDSLFCDQEGKYLTLLNKFRSFSINIMLPVWNSIHQWGDNDNDNDNIINLRAYLISAFVRFGFLDVIQFGSDQITSSISNNNGTLLVNDEGEIEGFNTNILQQIIECALTFSGSRETVLTELISIYDELNSEYQSYILRAIGAVYDNNKLLTQSLEFVLTSGLVRDQDKLRGLYSMRRCYGRDQVWLYLSSSVISNDSYWDQLFQIYGSGFSAQDITKIFDTFSKLSYYNDIYNFYFIQNNGNRITSSNERSVNETIENIQINIDWIERNNYELNIWLIEESFTTTIFNTTSNQVTIATSDDDESNHSPPLNYIWIIVIIILFVLLIIIAFRFLWKKKLSKSSMFQYQRQFNDDSDHDSGRNNFVNNNHYNNVTINSIDDDDIHHRDDDFL